MISNEGDEGKVGFNLVIFKGRFPQDGGQDWFVHIYDLSRALSLHLRSVFKEIEFTPVKGDFDDNLGLL